MYMRYPEMSMKEKIKLKEYHDYTRHIKYSLLFSGTWPITRPGILYRALPIIAITSIIVLSIMLFRFAIANITNINLMVKGFSFGTSYLSMAFKVFLLTIYRGSLIELHTVLKKYHTETLADDNLRYLVLKKLTDFQRLSSYLAVLVYSGCSTFFLTPLIIIIVQIRHHAQPVTYILPMPALYPWEIHPGGVVYTMTYIVETYTILCMVTITIGADSFFGYHAFHIVGQLQVLGYQMRNLQPSDNHQEFIHRWVEKFVVLRKCCKQLQQIYGPVILWQIITNSAVICTVLFQVSQATGTSIGKYIILGGYSGTKIVQTYLYASAGTAITNESYALREAVYFSDWLAPQRRRFRTSLLIILAQRPFEITAAGCVIISIDMFIMTLNTAVSYFFLLQTLEGKQS